MESSKTNERSNLETMDFLESTKVVLERVKKLEPENASKIVGHLLLQDHGEQEMINLAFAADDMFSSLISKTKESLNLSSKTNDSTPKDKKPIVSKLSTKFTPFVPSSSRFPTVPQVNNVQIDNYAPMYNPITNNFEYAPVSHFDSSMNGFDFHYQPQFMPLEGQMEYGSSFQNIPERAWNAGPGKSPVLPEMRSRQGFNDGYCKYGGQCKLLHVNHIAGDHIMVLYHPDSKEIPEYHALSHGYVKKLEMELVEILISKGSFPVPIASLPALYSEKYGKRLPNFMQGNVVCGLDELLAQMTSSIRMIQGPRGELCAILAEDVPMCMKSVEEKNEQEQALASSYQIYLTFSFRSTFTQQDIYDYFNNFGPVKGVRIPSQFKRMYGFVTFVYAETVTVVLTMGNPHFICGMQVLVKPYRGNQMFTDRVSDENLKFSIWSLTDNESKRLSSKTPITALRLSNNLSFPRKQLIIEEHEQSVDIKRKMEIIGSSSHNSSTEAVADPSGPGGVSIGCSNKGKSIMTCAAEEERYEELNLPDNPFEFEVSDYDASINSSEWAIKDLEL